MDRASLTVRQRSRESSLPDRGEPSTVRACRRRVVNDPARRCWVACGSGLSLYIPELPIDNRRVLARIGSSPVNDLASNDRASIDAVLQHQIKRSTREWFGTPQATRRESLVTRQASSSSFNNSHPAEFGIVGEDATVFGLVSATTSFRSCI